MSHVRRTWTVENKWTCTSCGAVNLGRFTSCQKCGNPKEPDEEAKETIDPNAVVTDSSLLQQAHEGPHWTCPYCDGKQRDPAGNCTNCGGAKKAEATIETSGSPEAPRVRITATGGSRVSNIHVGGRRVDEPKHAPKRAIAAIAASVVVFVGLLVWLFTPHELRARVASMKWIHMARYEERLVKHTEAWGTSSGAFNVSCSSRYYGTESCNPYQCNPHSVSYSCNGHSCNCRTSCTSSKNGFSNCSESCSTCYSTCYRTEYSTCYHQCPVYRDWCAYDYYDWVGRGERTLSGASAATMAWPDLGPIDETHRLVKTPAYVVNFRTADGETYSAAPDTPAEFEQYADDQEWVCQKAVLGFFKPLRRM